MIKFLIINSNICVYCRKFEIVDKFYVSDSFWVVYEGILVGVYLGRREVIV